MAPVRVLKSQRIPLARSYKSEMVEGSGSGSQSSDDDQVSKLAAEMQKEVLCVRPELMKLQRLTVF